MQEHSETRLIGLMRVPNSFHTIKKHTEPMKYQGGTIIAHVARCIHEKCGYRAAYANWGGAELGAWKHRQQHILAVRRVKLSKILANNRAVLYALEQFADKSSHTEAEYYDAVATVLRKSGVRGFDISAYEGRMLPMYNANLFAFQAARVLYTDVFGPMVTVPAQRVPATV